MHFALSAKYMEVIYGRMRARLQLTHDLERDGVALAGALGVDGPADVVPDGRLGHVLQDEALCAHYDAVLLVGVQHLTLKMKE